MQNIRRLILFALVCGLFMEGVYWAQHSLSTPIPITGVNWGIILLFSIWVLYEEFKDHARELTTQHKLLRTFFALFTVFVFGIAVPHLALFVYPELFQHIMSISYVVGHGALFIGLVFLVRIPLFWYQRRLTELASAAIAVIGVIAIMLHFLSTPVPVFDTATGVTFFGANTTARLLSSIVTAFAFVPVAIFFIYRGASHPKKIVRRRSIIFAAGLLVGTAGGTVQDLAINAGWTFVSDLLVFAGVAIFATGLFYTPQKQKELQV